MRCVIEGALRGEDSRNSLGELIEEAKEARELKRALSVQMTLSGRAVAQVGELLQVTPQ